MYNTQLQVDTKDDKYLGKFSYMMVGFPENGAEGDVLPLGTCFFVKREKKIYMVTAAHNITGKNTFDGKPTSRQFNFIGFRYLNTQTNEISFSKLDITSLKTQLPTDYFYKYPDAVGLPMTDPIVEPFIFALEDDMFNSVAEKENSDEIISPGYPYVSSSQYTKEMEPFFYYGVIVSKVALTHPYPSNENIYFISKPKSTMGISGAPVFTKYSQDGARPIYIFRGLMFGKNDLLDYAYVVKANSIIYY